MALVGVEFRSIVIRITRRPDGTVQYDVDTEHDFRIVQRSLSNGHSEERPRTASATLFPPPNLRDQLEDSTRKLFDAFALGQPITSAELRTKLNVTEQELGKASARLGLQLRQFAGLEGGLSDFVRRKRPLRKGKRLKIYTLTERGRKLVKETMG